MSLVRLLLHGPAPKRKRKPGPKPTSKKTKCEEDDAAPSLAQLCLLSLADNMKTVWVKDYADNCTDQYCFTHVMGPFNVLPGGLVEELTCLLCSRKQLSRAALHLLLVPQLRALSLASCPGLATSALCTHIAARCQALSRLDLSGAQQLSSQTQADLLTCLPALRFLSLSGTPCDRRVIRTLTHHCPALRHLDVSQCHFLSPAALLPLGGGLFSSASSPSGSLLTSPHSTSTSHSSHSSSAFSNSTSSSSLSPLPLSCLLALDIGFGEEEGDQAAAAAYLLLSLPGLEKVAVEGFVQACRLIHHREFSQTEEFTSREGVLRLEEVWRERRTRQGGDRGGKVEAGAEDGDDEEEEEDARTVWEEGYESEDEGTREETSGDEGMSGSQGRNTRTESRGEAERDGAGSLVSKPGDKGINLRLKEVQGLSFSSLEAVSRLCPDLCSITLDFDEKEDTGGWSPGSPFATGLRKLSGQLRSLSLRYPGPLVDLLPALRAAGSSLVSLSLEGVRTSPHSPLLELIHACPRLRDLLIHAEPPPTPQEEEEEEEMEDDWDLPSLPYLRSLTLNFSNKDQKRSAVMSWRCLKRALKCLLSGSPLLETVSLVAVPCNVNPVFQYVLSRPEWNSGHNQYRGTNSSELPPLPLGWLHHLNLAQTNTTMRTVQGIVEGCKRIRFLDLRSCWEMTPWEWMLFQRPTNITTIWPL